MEIVNAHNGADAVMEIVNADNGAAADVLPVIGKHWIIT